MAAKKKEKSNIVEVDPFDDEPTLAGDGLPPEPEDKGAEGAPKVPEEEPKRASGKYRVLQSMRISYGAQMVQLRAGTIVSAATHGPRYIEHLRNSGVALEDL